MATGRSKVVEKAVAKKAEKNKAEETKKKKASKKAPLVPVATAPVEAQVATSTLNPFTKNRERSHKEKVSELNRLRNANPDLMYPADEAENQYMLRRPTGIIELDIALGGGFPAGGACMLSGPFNSGKTWLLFRTIAMQQQIYGNDFMGALHVGEMAFPYDQAIQAGCRLSVPDAILNHWAEWRYHCELPQFTPQELEYMKTSVGHLEMIGGATGEEILTTVLSCVDSNIFSVVGIDSISSLQSAADITKELDDDGKRGAHATMMKKFWIKLVPKLNRGRNATSILMVQQVVANQERANFPAAMQKYLQEWTVKGGESTKHFKLIDLVMWSGDKINRTSSDERSVIGKWVKYRTLKGKAGTHDNIYGEFPYYYHLGGVDLHGELIASAIRRGVLLNVGNGVQVFNAETRQPVAGMFAKNEQELRQMFTASFDFELAFRREILRAAGKPCLYR